MAVLRILSCQTNRFSAHADCCHRKGAPDVLQALTDALQQAGLETVVQVEVGPCLGYCSVGPNLRVVGHDLLNGVTVQAIPALVDRLRELVSVSGMPEPPAHPVDSAR